MNDKEELLPEIIAELKKFKFRIGGGGLIWQSPQMAKLIEDAKRVLTSTTADDVEKISSMAVVEAAEERAKLFTRIMDIPEPKWLVEGLAVKEGITLVFGEQHLGKTSLMLQLIASDIVSKKFISLNLDKLSPLLIEQDENPSLLRGHVERMLPKCPTLKYLDVPNDVVLWNNDKADFAGKLLDNLIDLSAANLVIIDSISSLGIADINHPSCSLIFDRLRVKAKKWGCAFILLHHPNKAGEIMGSKLIEAKCDFIWEVKKGKIILRKCRSKIPPSFHLTGADGDPYMELKQDPATLFFTADTAGMQMSRYELMAQRLAKTRELVASGKDEREIVTIIQKEYPISDRQIKRDIKTVK